MDPVNSPAPYQNDEIDLFELFESLWKEKVLIVAITLVITLIGGGIAFILPPTYQASVKLYPPHDYQIIEEKKIALFDISTQSQSQLRAFENYLAFLRSRDLLSDISKNKGLVVEVITPKTGLVDEATLKLSASYHEGLDLALSSLIDMALIEYQDAKLIAFKASRDLCKEVLTLMPKDFAVNESDSACLKSKRLVGVGFDKSSLKPFSLDSTEIRTSNHPVKPKRSSIVALSAVVGGMLAIVFVLIRNAVRNRKTVS